MTIIPLAPDGDRTAAPEAVAVAQPLVGAVVTWMQPQPMSAITGIPRSSTLPTLLVDGLVTGMWERRARGRRIQITVEAIQCTHLRAAQAAGGWAARVGAFYGADASLAIGVLT